MTFFLHDLLSSLTRFQLFEPAHDPTGEMLLQLNLQKKLKCLLET
jgi:hypothetical protein